MFKSIEIPKYLDVLLIINDGFNNAKLLRTINRSQSYIVSSIKYLEEKELIIITTSKDDDRKAIIKLTDKGLEVQKIVINLYNYLGLNN